MRIFKSLCIAFSMYSKIPVPQFEWKEEDMKYSLCFLPFVGIVIGGLLVFWKKTADYFSVGNLCFVMIAAAVPVLVTGGIHIDGYMDTMDALHSYQDREKKLEILKDPHIGAFSVIMLLVYYLLYLGFLAEADTLQIISMTALGMIWSRILGALSVVTLNPSKKNGLLRIFADAASRKIVIAVLTVEGLICLGIMCSLAFSVGISIMAATGLWFWYYRHRCYKEFGGVSGDTAGYFITICELIVIMTAVAGFHF